MVLVIRVQIVNLDYSVNRNLPRVHYFCSFRNCQWDELCYVLRNVPWDIMYTFDDINDQWAFFHTILNECLDHFLPLCKVCSRKSRRPTQWFSKEISDLIKLKHMAKRKAQRSNVESDKTIYKQYKNELKSVIRQAKLDYLQSSSLQAKSQLAFAAELWSRINGVLNRTTSPTRANISISSDVLNNFFQNVTVTPSHQPASSFSLPADNTDSSFSFNDIPVDTVFKLLSSLDIQNPLVQIDCQHGT